MPEYRSPEGNSNNLFGRLIIALLIALFGWFMYMYNVEENPVTKERQHVAISPADEVRLGLEAAPAMAQEMGGEVPASDPQAQEVQYLGQFLVNHTIAKNSPWKFKFHLLADENTVNAFALPGGQIFITLGLLNKLQTEAQFAGVLAHEMGHVIERHSAEQMATGRLGQILTMAVGTAASSDQSNAGYQVAALVNQMMQLRYSRKDESEADTWGLKLMAESGFDPRAMIEVMKVLKAASGGAGGGSEIFQTHPHPELRIKDIEAYLAKYPPAPGLTEGRKLSEVYGNQLKLRRPKTPWWE